MVIQHGREVAEFPCILRRLGAGSHATKNACGQLELSSHPQAFRYCMPPGSAAEASLDTGADAGGIQTAVTQQLDRLAMLDEAIRQPQQ